MKKHFIIAVTASILGGCGFMTPAKQYPGEVHGLTSIAVIKGLIGTPFSDDYHATITGFTKVGSPSPDGQKEFGLPGFTDYPREVQVLPGEYQIRVYCFRGFSSFRPETSLTVVAGNTYSLSCEIRDGQAVIVTRTSST